MLVRVLNHKDDGVLNDCVSNVSVWLGQELPCEGKVMAGILWVSACS